MDNIYGHGEFERNSIVELPDGFADNLGNTLYSWLGSIWRGVHQGDGMVRGIQKSRGMLLAQLYLDLIEAARLQDRNGMPVFHRELWHPIVIRKSDRNKAQENMVYVGMDANIGPQTDPESRYGEGTVLKMGRLANYADYVTYPVKGNVVGMSASIVDNIINPSVVLHHDNGDGSGDFEFRNDSIIFPKDKDPLAEGSKFEKCNLPCFTKENADDPDSPEVADEEAVLWASDVLIDKNYVAEHLSYALGAFAPSTDVVKRILNAAWGSVASGLTPELIKTLVAAMLNVPVVQNSVETVVDINISPEAKEITTDKGVYRVSPKARLANGLHAGSVLRGGDLLDESIRIYPFLNGVSAGESACPANSCFSVPLMQDIPSVVMPRSLIKAKTEYGIYAMWGETRVKRSSASPGRDGFPHLYFDIGGMESDKDAFWRDVWRRYDEAGVSMETTLGEEGGMVSPAAFFLRNLVGANTIFIVVDKSQLDDVSLLHDPMFFGMLTSVVPSAIRLFMVEHRSVAGEDEMDFGEDSQESMAMHAALPGKKDGVSYNEVPGRRLPGASYEDRVMMRFIRPVPTKIGACKEEE